MIYSFAFPETLDMGREVAVGICAPPENEFVLLGLHREMSVACSMASGPVWRPGVALLQLAQPK